VSDLERTVKTNFLVEEKRFGSTHGSKAQTGRNSSKMKLNSSLRRKTQKIQSILIPVALLSNHLLRRWKISLHHPLRHRGQSIMIDLMTLFRV